MLSKESFNLNCIFIPEIKNEEFVNSYKLKEITSDELAYRIIEKDKKQLPILVALLKAEEVPMTVRIGVSAILEGLQDDPAELQKILPDLLELSESADETTRADACQCPVAHDFSTGGRRSCLADPDPDPGIRNSGLYFDFAGLWLQALAG